jgi:hypothetical protein
LIRDGRRRRSGRRRSRLHSAAAQRQANAQGDGLEATAAYRRAKHSVPFRAIEKTQRQPAF